MALTQPHECVVRQRVMKPLQIERKMDPPDRRQVFEKEQIGKNERRQRYGFAGVQEPMLLQTWPRENQVE
jgi:hypothetical protein